MKTINDWNSEQEKQICKSFYDSVLEFLETEKRNPFYCFHFLDGTEIIVKYLEFHREFNSVEDMYFGKEVPKHLKNQEYEDFYYFSFRVIKIEKLGKENAWIKDAVDTSLGNIGLSYHSFPIKFELIKDIKERVKNCIYCNSAIDEYAWCSCNEKISFVQTLTNAWRKKNVIAIISLFAENCEYWETPYKRIDGMINIQKEWEAIETMKEMQVDHRVLAIWGNTIIINFKLRTNEYEQDIVNEFRLENGKCVYMKQWFMSN